MLATAAALQEVTVKTVWQDAIQDHAEGLLDEYASLTFEQMQNALFYYSMNVAAMAVTLASAALMTEDEQQELLEAMVEMKMLSENVLAEEGAE